MKASFPLRAALSAALLLGAVAVAQAQTTPPKPGQSEMIQRPGARLQGLDKITARTSTFDVAVGQTAGFGGLQIAVRACRENPPTEPPEAAAFLDVVELSPGEPPKAIFDGWMFASSPALSAMEHAVYDVWVLSCVGE